MTTNKLMGQLCIGCGSSWSDERLDREKRINPKLISCCLDRKMMKVYSAPDKPLEDKQIDDLVHGVVASAMLIAMDTNEIDAARMYREIGRAIEKAHGIE